MVKKCKECGERLEEDELGKLKGTVIKNKKAGKNEIEYICQDCQKKAK